MSWCRVRKSLAQKAACQVRYDARPTNTHPSKRRRRGWHVGRRASHCVDVPGTHEWWLLVAHPEEASWLWTIAKCCSSLQWGLKAPLDVCLLLDVITSIIDHKPSLGRYPENLKDGRIWQNLVWSPLMPNKCCHGSHTLLKGEIPQSIMWDKDT